MNIQFDEQGTEDFGAVSTACSACNGQTPRDQFAFVLDGAVLTAPQMNGAITDGRPQITGNFTQESSKSLADQLKFGALPISFTVQSSDTISATLGTSQLQSGLIAGLIGLILVVIYTLFQYRALGSVTIASLAIVGLITYLMITILSWREGYRLSLAGIAGLIVAIGFTADSFIVYFERVRDELRDGRPLVGAVEAGWKRAFRTILASKGVNLLAAVVLFILAVGSVKGFAYTLGLTTIIDVVVVILFTHPMLQLLAQTRFFSSGNPWSGLDPNALGAVYRGRAEFRKPVAVPASKVASSSKEAQKRQTIAERKATASVGSGDERRQGVLMANRLTTFGNDLYTGKRSFNFVGGRKKWYAIAGVLIILTVLIPRAARRQLQHRVPRRFAVPDRRHRERHARARDRRRGVGRARGRRARHDRRRRRACGCRPTSSSRPTRARSPRPSPRPTACPSPRSRPRSSARAGVRMSRGRRSSASSRSSLLAGVIMAIYFRTWKMSLAAILALHRRPRRHGRHLRRRRLRDQPRGDHRHPDDPRVTRSTTPSWCSTRSARTPRKTARSRAARSPSR